MFSSAQREAAEEIHRKNDNRAAKKRAVEALQSCKAVDRAKEHFKSAKALLAQKNAALKQAQNYKQRSDSIRATVPWTWFWTFPTFPSH
jgi:hypothetical protein